MKSIDFDDLGVPTLDPARQLLALTPPVVPYGSVARSSRMPGTYHFYVADHKFTRLFARPDRVLASGCVGCVEPNCSTGPGVPPAAALFGIYRKRAVAALWQSWGLGVCVDLNVDDSVLPFALLGVPEGWRSYAVRSHRFHGLDWVTRRHELAAAHAGGGPVFFVVVGGGKALTGACADRGWHHVPEYCRLARLKAGA